MDIASTLLLAQRKERNDLCEARDSVWGPLYLNYNSEENSPILLRCKNSKIGSTSSILQFPLHSVLRLPRTQDILVFYLLSVLDGLLGHFLSPVLFGDRGFFGGHSLAIAR